MQWLVQKENILHEGLVMKKHLIIATVLLGSSSIFGSESATKRRQTVKQVPAARFASYANYSKETRQAWLETRDTVPVAIRLAEANILLASLLRSDVAPNHLLDAVLEDLTGLYQLSITDNSKLNDEEDAMEFNRLTRVARSVRAGLPLTDDQETEANRILQLGSSNRNGCLSLMQTMVPLVVLPLAIFGLLSFAALVSPITIRLS